MTQPSRTSAIPVEGEIIGGRYRVERILGQGGMGVVLAARHVQLDQRVAIKFLRADAGDNPDAQARFLREARAAVVLKSEHVSRVFDVGTREDGAPYMVMEFLDGVDAEQMLRQTGPMAVPVAVGIVLQACEAVAEAHAAGIIHRDLKPANLFVTQQVDGSPLVKVLDFGISKATRLADDAAGLTATGVLMGSPGYMSPEQIRSAHAVDARSDIWALGVILYELLTGVSPFAASTLGDILARILTQTPAPMRTLRPDIPPPLDVVVMRCLERDPTRRVQSVGELVACIVQFAAAAPGSAERVARIERGPSSAGRTLDAGVTPSMGMGGGAPFSGAPWQHSIQSATRSPGRAQAAWGLSAVGLLVSIVGIATMYARRASQSTDSTPNHDTTPGHEVFEPKPHPTSTPSEERVPVSLEPGMLVEDSGVTPLVLGYFHSAGGPPSGWFGAVDGNGRVAWSRGGPDDMRGLRVLDGTTLVVVRDGGEVFALDAVTGGQLWTQYVADVVASSAEVCAGASMVGVRAAGHEMARFGLTDGSGLGTGPSPDCSHAYTSLVPGPNFTVVEGADAARTAADLVPGSAHLSVRRILVPFVGTARVLLGADRSSGAPAVAVVTPGKVLWRASLAAIAAAADLTATSQASVRYGRVIVPYVARSPRALRVASFDLRTGDRLFDTTLGHDADDVTQMAIVTDGASFLRTAGGRLWSCDATGSPRLLVGAQ